MRGNHHRLFRVVTGLCNRFQQRFLSTFHQRVQDQFLLQQYAHGNNFLSHCPSETRNSSKSRNGKIGIVVYMRLEKAS